jgi:hypothetical protein
MSDRITHKLNMKLDRYILPTTIFEMPSGICVVGRIVLCRSSLKVPHELFKQKTSPIESASRRTTYCGHNTRDADRF